MEAEPLSEPLHIVYDADGLLLVDKPAGLPSTGRDLDDPACAQHRLQLALKRRVWAVHQLDAETSGLLLFVRRRTLVAPWAARLKAGRKTYLALVHGDPPDRFVAEQPLDWVAAQRRRWVTPGGKPARTAVLTLARGPDAAWVRARISTGRTHQVRIHLAFAGHPLVGEARYRSPPCALHGRHALHAWRVDLPGLERLEAALPPDLQDLSRRLGVGLPTG